MVWIKTDFPPAPFKIISARNGSACGPSRSRAPIPPSRGLILARREAISYAAYRLLKERHAYSKTFTTTLAADDAQMTALGYDTNNVSHNTNTPAGVGNSVYDAVSAWFINDGARQTNGTQAAPYPDYPQGSGGYVYVNPPLATTFPGITDGFGSTVTNVKIGRAHV